MKIKLPPLPRHPEPHTYQWTELELEELRALQLATTRAVQDACAMACDEWSKANHVYVNGALRCAHDIRALEFET